MGLDNRRAVYLALENLPTGIFATYDQALKRIEAQPPQAHARAKQVLMWISCTMRPMTVNELQHALAIDLDDLDTTRLDRDAIPVKSGLTSVCAGLVVIDLQSQVIRLVHETAQSYLEERRLCLFPRAQEYIARICLTYLSFDTFDTGRCSSPELFKIRLQDNAFLNYAALYWGKHVDERVVLNIRALALKFLKDDQRISCASQVMMRGRNGYRSSFHDGPDMSSLHICSYFGLKALLEDVLVPCNAVDVRDSRDRTPLCYAAEFGHEAVVKLLLDRGATADLGDYGQWTPGLLAVRSGHVAVLKLLLNKGSSLISRDGGAKALFVAAENGREAVIELLLDEGADVHSKNSRGTTLLRVAAEKRHDEVVKLLLDKWSVTWGPEFPIHVKMLNGFKNTFYILPGTTCLELKKMIKDVCGQHLDQQYLFSNVDRRWIPEATILSERSICQHSTIHVLLPIWTFRHTQR